MTEKYAWEGKGLDEVSAKELWLWIENDGDLYRQQYTPIIKNLVATKARGIYDHTKAVKLFGYLVESGAKKYYAENVEGKRGYAWMTGVGSGWHDMFPKKLRDAVAEELRDGFEVEYGLGNYDQYIPKKYQPKVTYVAGKRKSSKGRFGATTSLGGIR